ncbi:MAG: hypothetical protein IH803_08620 [Nitrospirae bacterium]|nr:hypothetical protein [Nitrospirota bacterium]
MVVEIECQFAHLLGMTVEIIRQQDLMLARTNMLDSHLAIRIDLEDLFAPEHRK